MSVQGSVADRLGDHEGAQKFYTDALKIAPASLRCCPISASPTR